MSYSRDISQPIFDRALNVLVKGVSSNFRFLGEKETPYRKKGKVPMYGMLMIMHS
ncbi:hypothetical protein Ct9H90mP29_00290 [bacterium]|nr:MAG: hypothetical protein Ct9H90mP29_00290 [bacterium]